MKHMELNEKAMLEIALDTLNAVRNRCNRLFSENASVELQADAQRILDSAEYYAKHWEMVVANQ